MHTYIYTNIVYTDGMVIVMCSCMLLVLVTAQCTTGEMSALV